MKEINFDCLHNDELYQSIEFVLCINISGRVETVVFSLAFSKFPEKYRICIQIIADIIHHHANF